MPQDQFYGFPERGFEPDVWVPRFCQVSTNAWDPQRTIPLRKPNNYGTVQVVGQRVFAEATVTFDVGGGGNFTLFIELPHIAIIQSGSGSQNIGSFYMEHPGGNMYQGVCAALYGTNLAIFRAGTGISANGFGNGPAVTVAAGDAFSVSLGYFANV